MTVVIALGLCISPQVVWAAPLRAEEPAAGAFLAQAEAWLGRWLSVLYGLGAKDGAVAGVDSEAGAASSQEVDGFGEQTDEGWSINPDG